MKGVSLPINVIVIIAIAVLVLVVLAGFFGGYFGGSALQVQRERALDDACNKARSFYSCALDALDDVEVTHQDSGDPEPRDDYSLRDLCRLRGIGTDGSHVSGDLNECLLRCNCPIFQSS